MVTSLSSPLFPALLFATSVGFRPRWSGPLSCPRLRGGQRYHHHHHHLRLLFLLPQAAVILSLLFSITTWHEEKGRREKPVVASYHKGNLKKPDLEVLFIPRLMLRFPPILAGTKFHLEHFHRPSKSGFFKFPLLSPCIPRTTATVCRSRNVAIRVFILHLSRPTALARHDLVRHLVLPGLA